MNILLGDSPAFEIAVWGTSIKHQMFQTHVDLSDRNVMNILA